MNVARAHAGPEKRIVHRGSHILSVAATLAQLGAQITGEALVRSFLKLIPGAGSVIGGGVAVALTAATGEGWLRLCEQVHTGKLDLGDIEQSWGRYAPGLLDVIRRAAEQRVRKP